jgi:(E)-4-hydroxy-3-methylbut-2-enyl-diphosphate synthase
MDVGHAGIPLVADIHFNPECAMEAANHVEKIRVNPGNYADSKAFKIVEYTDAEYDAELQRIEERFLPLVQKCKALGRAMRIGCNHGSLSDRIMNRYGDTPEGMVEAALEFVRICEKNDYFDIVLSMKASNPKVMIAAYRLLVTRMDQEDMHYPLHLGVTEAGYGEDGRIKSAIGIGSLLNDGIGDTIRVSLTEDPEFEIPVAEQIAQPYQVPSSPPVAGGGLHSDNEPRPAARRGDIFDGPGRVNGQLSHVASPFSYSRRATRELTIGPFKLGGENTVRVISDLSAWLNMRSAPAVPGGDAVKATALKILGLLEEQLKSGKEMVPEILDWTIAGAADLDYFKGVRRALGGETSRLAFLGRFKDLAVAQEGLAQVHLAQYEAPRNLAQGRRTELFRTFLRAAKSANVPVLLEAGPSDRGLLAPAAHLQRGIAMAEEEGVTDLLLALRLPSAQELIANARWVVAHRRRSGQKDYPFHLNLHGPDQFDVQRIEASVAFGSLLCDGIGDSVQLGSDPGWGSSAAPDPRQTLELLYNILQGAGVRITKTEYVSCPSCGRTLFDLQTTTERIKQKTGHLKGVKIAIMGCIVNGPGEMADADFGYVGGAPGKINLYVGKNCVEKGIPFEQSDQRLIELIKAHGKWVDPVNEY